MNKLDNVWKTKVANETSTLIKNSKFKDHPDLDSTHCKEVLAFSLAIYKDICELTKDNILPYIDINEDNIFVTSIYHGIGATKQESGYDLISGRIVRKSEILKEHFAKGDIEKIAQAIEDHNNTDDFRNVYGAILATANLCTSHFSSMHDAYEDAKRNDPRGTIEQWIDSAAHYLKFLYGARGEAWYNIPIMTPHVKQYKETTIALFNNITAIKRSYKSFIPVMLDRE